MKAQSNLKTTRSRRDTIYSVGTFRGDQPPGLTHGAVRRLDGRASERPRKHYPTTTPAVKPVTYLIIHNVSLILDGLTARMHPIPRRLELGLRTVDPCLRNLAWIGKPG